MNVYKLFIRPFLFLINPEAAHHVVFSLLKKILAVAPVKYIFTWIYKVNDIRLERDVFGICFPNPVGLAAGLDKNAKLFNELSCLGFGFVEIGTITPRPQVGNPKPRLFRLPEDEALINRMGFNNDGIEPVIERLKKRSPGVVVGGNIGKNKNTPNEMAMSDYEQCFNELFDYVDYFVVNLSSPNTPDLRKLQEKEPLMQLLARLQEINRSKNIPKPILLKIAPDLNETQLDDIIDVVKALSIPGIIATNTTIYREGLTAASEKIEKIGAGGMSGKPLFKRSLQVVKYLHQRSEGKYRIIASGGIHNENQALEMIRSGAALVQLYTGFIYEGPRLIKRINKAILEAGVK